VCSHGISFPYVQCTFLKVVEQRGFFCFRPRHVLFRSVSSPSGSLPPNEDKNT
jgi:hypothetical protein